jgi:ubiquinone/menaquinone biosynthesis C-methylase UbiE
MSTFREFEQQGWQTVAGGYHDHFVPLTSQSIEPLLDAVAAGGGTHLLDDCTGPGYVAATAARRGALATGLDFSLPMIEIARRQWRELPRAPRFLVGDAEQQGFPAASFDSVVSNYGILHLARPDEFLAEAFRILRPGGRLAFTVWAVPAEAVIFGIVHHAVESHGDPAVVLPPGPPFFRFADATESERTLRRIGFAEVSVSRVPQFWRPAGPDGIFDAFITGGVRTRGLLLAQTPEAQARIRAAIREAIETYRTGDGISIPTPAMLISARK